MSTPARSPLAPALVDAIAAGFPVVTPNNRLARRINARYDALQMAAGRRAWTAATALPWNAWITRLWQEAVGVDPPGAPRRLLTPTQIGWLWQRIVGADSARRAPLMDVDGAAALAQEAWDRMHAWGAGGESWRGWDDATAGEDPAAFARWAGEYRNALTDAEAIDLALAPDRLVAMLPALRGVIGGTVVVAGFTEFTAQQQRFLTALQACAVAVTRCPTADCRDPDVRVLACPTAHDEIALALAWARDRSVALPGATIGIVVLDLAARRDEVRALADEVLCPGLQWPGNESAVRPYDLSLGSPLADASLVAAALGLLRLGRGSVPAAEAAVLLRSCYLPGDDQAWMRRAGVEGEWRKAGVSAVDIEAMIRAVGPIEPALASRWRAALNHRRWPARASPSAWVELWRAWLTALGWPGERTADSSEFQVRGAWEELLAGFAALGSLERALSGRDATAALAGLAARQVFQPEAPAASVQILGALEAAALPFDALWVAGLAAEVWPPSAAPNPLLPIAWQREHNLPRSSAAREHAWARALTGEFSRAAPEVVFSYARTSDDHLRLPSALLAEWEHAESAAAPPRFGAMVVGTRPRLEAIDDSQAPPVPAGATMSGGASLIERQAECPFRALAMHRLGVLPWPKQEEGLSALDRGNLVHRAMLEFWREVNDQATLLALDDATRIRVQDDAVSRALASDAVPAERWRQVSELIAGSERDRVRALLDAWIAGFERARPPFRVAATELAQTLCLAGISLRLRIDRVDELVSGGIAVVDYKTGVTIAPAKWFEARPQAPQLGLYALALQAQQPQADVCAVAYARMKIGELGWSGVAADGALWPGLAVPGDITAGALPDWGAALAFWTSACTGLAAEAAAGHAPVLPRDPATTCRHCGLQALCRVGSAEPDTDGATPE
jgi:ATP-dependent helicase/nuclease subunit B